MLYRIISNISFLPYYFIYPIIKNIECYKVDATPTRRLEDA